ncbi:FecR domain-containing protein [Aeoliella mucimassa]|uniref:FecR protein n=1 Tax=Aeoliella mucimassa TaxID=2527972 RepID=A0A518APE4_9BACT|nr:FecR domain-containing protein [Aeoliella mucimassa]QDU56600.1 FecR protein [Aeoliella mucimassa]
MSPDEIFHTMPELPRLVEAWQLGTLHGEAKHKLSELLLNNRDARQYFIELTQIDSELRWRYSSQSHIAPALAHDVNGSTIPAASIVIRELGIREDVSFYQVFELVEHSELHAQLWLQVYIALRACLFMGLRLPSDAEAAVDSVCSGLMDEPLTEYSPDRFCSLALNLAVEQFAVWQGVDAERDRSVQQFEAILKRSLRECEAVDVVALYESVEDFVPRHVPASALRVLCMRYLLELSPGEISRLLSLPLKKVLSQLAECRLKLWNACATSVKQHASPTVMQGFNLFYGFVDASESFGLQPEGGRRQSASAQFLQDLDSWCSEGEENGRCLLAMAVAHEALYRRLSLNVLLEDSSTRRDEAFHHVLTDMVLYLEETSPSVPSEPSVAHAPRRSRFATAWGMAIAAAVLIAASMGYLMLQRDNAVSPDTPVLAQQEREVPSNPLTGADIREATSFPEVPVRIAVATVKTSLGVVGRSDTDYSVGNSVYANEPIELTEGIVELITPSGSEWVLEAPVSLYLDDQGVVDLKHGKLVGLNSGQANALIVETPTARVLDTGTEFGVSVGDLQTTSVAVYEGAIELSSQPFDLADPKISPIEMEADYQAVVEQGGQLPKTVDLQMHDREFIRPDEVALRVEQQHGSAEAADKVAFYELLRIEGLLAYQGFHAESYGEAYAVGFETPRAISPLRFGSDLLPIKRSQRASESLVIGQNTTVFMNLDVSERSRLARAGLLNSSGDVGKDDSEVWMSWWSQMSLSSDQRFDWTGVSLMYGDKRNDEEPVFFGQPSGASGLGVRLYPPGNEAMYLFDTDRAFVGVQPLAIDNQSHFWTVRMAFGDDSAAVVSVWLDTELEELSSTPPLLVQAIPNLKFDRLRLESSSGKSSDTCTYDEFVLAQTLESLVKINQHVSGLRQSH